MSAYNTIVTPMLNWLHANPNWSGLITFVISFSESLAVVGTIVPGSITMAAIGVLIGSGIIPALSTFIYAVVGAVLGDNASYYLGYYCRDRIVDYWPFRRYPTLLEQGKEFFSRHGGKSVFLGRFFGPLRAIIPVIAGMMQMSNVRFFIANVTSGFLWSLLYLMPGVLLGAAAQMMTPEKATKYLLYTLIVLLLLWLMFKLVKHIAIHTSKQTQFILERLWRWFHRHPQLERFASLIAEGEKPLSITQLSLLLASAFLIAVFCLLTQVIYHHGFASEFNDSIAYLSQSIRFHYLDVFFVLLSATADKFVIIPVLLIVTSVLYSRGLKSQAWILLSLLSSTVFGVGLIKHALYIQRPEFITIVKSSSSYPSGHTTLAMITSFFLSFLYYKKLKTPWRQYFLIAPLSYSIAVAFSRVYLGQHWFTDTLAATLLGGALLCFHLLLLRRKPLDVNKLPTLTTIIVVWLVIGLSYGLITLSIMQKRIAINPYPAAITYDKWLQQGDNRTVRLWRRNRLGKPVQFLNLQTNISLSALKQDLLKNGWQLKPSPRFKDYLEYYLNPTVNNYEPLLNPLYLGHKADITLVRALNGMPVMLKLWRTKTQLIDSKATISIGAIYKVHLKSRHGAFKHLHVVSFQTVSKKYLSLKSIKVKTLNYNKQPLYLLINTSD